jgi:hypothetical protein
MDAREKSEVTLTLNKLYDFCIDGGGDPERAE